MKKSVFAIPSVALAAAVSCASPAAAATPQPGGNIVTYGIMKSYTCSTWSNPSNYCNMTFYSNSTKVYVHHTARIYACSKHYSTPEGTYVGSNGSGLRYLVNSAWLSVVWGTPPKYIGQIACYNPM